MDKIVNGKNGLVCAFCGATKPEVTFLIGAGRKPDWCMIYGTGKMACPSCYDKAMAEAKKLGEKRISDYNKACL